MACGALTVRFTKRLAWRALRRFRISGSAAWAAALKLWIMGHSISVRRENEVVRFPYNSMFGALGIHCPRGALIFAANQCLEVVTS